MNTFSLKRPETIIKHVASLLRREGATTPPNLGRVPFLSKEDAELIELPNFDDKVRNWWYSYFNRGRSDAARMTYLGGLRRAFEAMTYRVNDPEYQGDGGIWEVVSHGKAFGEMLMKLNMNSAPDNPIIIPIMARGFPCGAAAFDILRSMGKNPDYALMSYSTGRKQYKNNEIEDAIYIPSDDLQYLKQNKDRPVIIVDHVVDSGKTLNIMNRMLHWLGCNEIYVLTAQTGLVKCDNEGYGPKNFERKIIS